MSFEYPWLAWGALAALLPVAIHLINRQRAKVVRFAALEHLLQSDKRLAQRLKLRQLIVLVLRMALMAFLALALAKPSLDETVSVVGHTSGPGAIALVIDDSMSMNARMPGDDETLLDKALEIAEARVAGGGPSTSFALITASVPAQLLTPSVTFDREALARALSRIRPGARAADLGGALREAERVLAESGQSQRHVVIISDHAAHVWEELDRVWALEEPPEVERIDVRDGAPIDNIAITGVDVRPSLPLGPEHLTITASIANHAERTWTSEISVHLGQHAAQASVTLEPSSEADVSVTLKRPPGDAPPGHVQLPEDPLVEDNTWTFGLGEGMSVHVGLVNGAPHDVPTLDEVFFLRAALDTSGPGAPIKTTMLDGTRLLPKSLAHLDVLILANPGAMSPASLAAVRGFVTQGGGLLISAGDRLTPQAAQGFEELIPVAIRGHKEVADPSDPNAALSALRISDFDLEHPVTALFAAVDDVSLLKARTFKVALLDPSGRRVKVLASFSGGLPALVEAHVGQGRSILLTTSVDRDWSDLALRTSFVPLVHQLMDYLAQRGEGKAGANVTLGQEVEVGLPGGRGSLVLIRPDGAEVIVEAPEEHDGDDVVRRITLNDIDLPGRYTLRRRVGAQQATTFNAHPALAESNLRPVSPARVESVLGPSSERPLKAGVGPSLTREETSQHPLWPYLLVALFVLLGSETWFVLRQ